MDNGFVRIACAVPEIRVADCQYNADKIIETIYQAEAKGVEFIVFPELSITSYSCGDLFFQDTLIQEAYKQLVRIVTYTVGLDVVVIVGMPLRLRNQLFSCGVVLHNGRIIGVVPKTCIVNNKGYGEGRWFSSGCSSTSHTHINIFGEQVPFGRNLIFNAKIYKTNTNESGGNNIGNDVTIHNTDTNGNNNSDISDISGTSCISDNDIISFSLELGSDLQMVLPPSSYHSMAGAHIIFNLSAAMEEIGYYEYRKDLVRLQSNKCNAAYAYTSAGLNETTTDGVFGGYAVISENGTILSESSRFEMESKIIYADIDIDKIKSEKNRNICFLDHSSAPEISYRYISFSINSRETRYFKQPKQTDQVIQTEEIKQYEQMSEQAKHNEQDYMREKPLKPCEIPLERHIDPYPFIPSDENIKNTRYTEIFDIQASGLAMRMKRAGLKKGVIGISGGLDSTLALLVAVKAFDKLGLPRNNIIAITMPGFGTTGTTFNSSLKLIESVGATLRKIDIKQACLQHFKDIGHDADIFDTTYENVQARERTQILMDIANKEGGLVIGTGDLSELALGWCTYNGDHMSMYAVNAGVPKTLIKSLLFWAADNMADKDTKDILYRIIDTPITPELLPPDAKGEIKQKTEDIVGPYELHDFFIYYILRYGATPQKVLFLAQQAFKDKYEEDEIKKWLKTFYRRFFTQQFKRSCMPDGPKIGTISLSPRGGWIMPSDAQMAAWMKELED